MLNEDTKEEIIESVYQLIDVLKSKEVALDGRHTPALYSRFLATLLAKYNVKPPHPKPTWSSPDSSQFYAENTMDRFGGAGATGAGSATGAGGTAGTAPGHGGGGDLWTQHWPDVGGGTTAAYVGREYRPIGSHSPDQMDFSLNHFSKY